MAWLSDAFAGGSVKKFPFLTSSRHFPPESGIPGGFRLRILPGSGADDVPAGVRFINFGVADSALSRIARVRCFRGSLSSDSCWTVRAPNSKGARYALAYIGCANAQPKRLSRISIDLRITANSKFAALLIRKTI